jgi:hypothetical protein
MATEIPENLLITDNLVTRLLDGLAGSNPKIIVQETDQDPSGRTLLPTVSRDIDSFFEEVNVVLKDYQTRLKINERDQVRLTEEYPPVDLKTEIISYKIIQRIPGTVSQARPGPSEGSGERKEWVPRCRYMVDDPQHPNAKTIVMGQFFDNMVEFTCWARTNKAANRTALLFQDLMSVYRFYFKLKGFPEVLFKERLEDITLDSQNQGNSLKGRKMKFLVRTDRTFSITEPVLRDIILTLGLSSI